MYNSRMAIVEKSIEVPYSATKMYALVDSIEDYPEFVPACSKSEIISRTEHEVRATLHFSGGGFQKSFSTCNRLQPSKMIEIRLLNGPFKQLEGFWRFEALPDDGCKVTLDLEFEFSSKLLALAFGPIFHQVVNTLVDAFDKRARDVYGDR